MKRNLFLITENERERILGLHENSRMKEWGLINEQAPAAVAPAPAAVAPATVAPASVAPAPVVKPINTVSNQTIKQGNSGDPYQYKREGGLLFYAKKGQTNWTEQKNPKGIAAITKMYFSDLQTNVLPKSVSPTTAQPTQLAGVDPTTGKAVVAQPTTAPVAAQSTTAVTVTNPELAADLKSASEIRQEFRQGKQDKRKLQRQYDKMYRTYNRLSDKMDKKTDADYLTALNGLKDQLGQS